MIRPFVYLISFLFIGLPALCLAVLILVHEDEAVVAGAEKPLSHQNVKRIKQLIKQNYPSRFRRKHFKIVRLPEEELNLIAGYGMQRLVAGKVELSLKPQQVNARASIVSPLDMFGRYINISGELRIEEDMYVELVHIRLGKLTLPGWALNPLLNYTHRWLAERYPEYREVFESIRNFQVQRGQIIAMYEWRPDLIKRIQARGENMILEPQQRQRIIRYHNYLVKHNGKRWGKRESAAGMMQAMFAFAQVQSRESNDPVAENKALLLTLSAYAQGVNLARVMTRQKGERIYRPAYVGYELHQRHDLFQHYLVSAGLTVAAGMGIADALGLAKELSDSMGGSGFSFADLIADRSGVEFAKLATKDKVSASSLQAFMASTALKESDFMPAITRLQEGLSEQRFKQRYKEVGSPEYKKIQSVIETRIKETPVFKAASN